MPACCRPFARAAPFAGVEHNADGGEFNSPPLLPNALLSSATIAHFFGIRKWSTPTGLDQTMSKRADRSTPNPRANWASALQHPVPSASHLITGIYDARLDHMPVLAIAAAAAAHHAPWAMKRLERRIGQRCQINAPPQTVAMKGA